MSDTSILVLLCLVALFYVRAAIVNKVGLRRLEDMHAANTVLIEAGEFERLNSYDGFNSQSYIGDVLDLRKWTYAQFYPDELRTVENVE